jgi:hypothetical protein
MDFSDLKIGFEFYYTGDRANADGFGEITAIAPSDATMPYPRYTVTLTDGRVFKALSKANFDNSAGRRFIPKAEYLEMRKQQFARFTHA